MKILSLSILSLFLFLQGTAQVALTVECQQDLQNSYYNNVSLDGNIVEYGICSTTPAFYITVIDTNCVPWATEYDVANPNLVNNFGYFNFNGNCRPRVEHFFVYRQTESMELMYMDSLLNHWIPDNHVISIWTPFEYNFNSVNAICPQLGNTLINKWGNEVQSGSMVVLFGVQGVPQSFSVDALTDGNSIAVAKSICSYSSLGIDEPSNSMDKSLVRIIDFMGRETRDQPNTLLIHFYSDGTTEKKFRVE